MARWVLPAEADLGHAPDLLTELGQQVAAAGQGELHLDATAMQAFDSSLLALMLEAQRRMHGAGGTLRISGAAPKLLELAQLYGVQELIFGAAQPA